jgi:hypothetical protein
VGLRVPPTWTAQLSQRFHFRTRRATATMSPGLAAWPPGSRPGGIAISGNSGTPTWSLGPRGIATDGSGEAASSDTPAPMLSATYDVCWLDVEVQCHPVRVSDIPSCRGFPVSAIVHVLVLVQRRGGQTYAYLRRSPWELQRRLLYTPLGQGWDQDWDEMPQTSTTRSFPISRLLARRGDSPSTFLSTGLCQSLWSRL